MGCSLRLEITGFIDDLWSGLFITSLKWLNWKSLG
jgi:hypothetical protein